MGKWSAGSLTMGYPRNIIGFDLRVCTRGQRTFSATIDNQVWPRQTNEGSLLEENGFNLFDGPLEKIDTIGLPKDSVLVAFDLPVALVNTLASTFGIVPLSINLLSGDKRWKFFGYDVVDARTQSSGIYSFDWTEKELADMRGRLSLSLNSNGLVDDESLAIKSAISFDLLVNEHAPFAPCGVWVNQRAN
jgi:hypothetical protein